MLTSRYVYKSDALQERYIEKEISYEIYMSSLEDAKEEELGTVMSYERTSKTQEIYDFELKQLNYANNKIKQQERDKINEEIRHRQSEERQKKIEEEEYRVRSLSPEERLYEEREKFYKEEVPKMIEEYKRESKKYRNTHDSLQWMIIIGSALVTSATSITIFTNVSTASYLLKGGSAICSLLVTIVAGFTGYFKYRERSLNLQKAADDIEHEYEAIKLGTHAYLNLPREEAMGVFANKIMSRIKEQREQQQILEQPSEATSSQIKSRTT